MSSLRPSGSRPHTPRTLVVGTFALVACGLALACSGCGDSQNLRVSGRVTFNGKPVPTGKIYFSPDASKQNKGPSGFADIKDGSYDTGQKGGRGVAGGPMVVRIEGFEEVPPTGDITTKQLFYPYEESVDLPKSSTTKDFEVPASATKPPKNPKTGTQFINP